MGAGGQLELAQAVDLVAAPRVAADEVEGGQRREPAAGEFDGEGDAGVRPAVLEADPRVVRPAARRDGDGVLEPLAVGDVADHGAGRADPGVDAVVAPGVAAVEQGVAVAEGHALAALVVVLGLDGGLALAQDEGQAEDRLLGRPAAEAVEGEGVEVHRVARPGRVDGVEGVERDAEGDGAAGQVDLADAVGLVAAPAVPGAGDVGVRRGHERAVGGDAGDAHADVPLAHLGAGRQVVVGPAGGHLQRVLEPLAAGDVADGGAGAADPGVDGLGNAVAVLVAVAAVVGGGVGVGDALAALVPPLGLDGRQAVAQEGGRAAEGRLGGVGREVAGAGELDPVDVEQVRRVAADGVDRQPHRPHAGGEGELAGEVVGGVPAPVRPRRQGGRQRLPPLAQGQADVGLARLAAELGDVGAVRRDLHGVLEPLAGVDQADDGPGGADPQVHVVARAERRVTAAVAGRQVVVRHAGAAQVVELGLDPRRPLQHRGRRDVRGLGEQAAGLEGLGGESVVTHCGGGGSPGTVGDARTLPRRTTFRRRRRRFVRHGPRPGTALNDAAPRQVSRGSAGERVAAVTRPPAGGPTRRRGRRRVGRGARGTCPTGRRRGRSAASATRTPPRPSGGWSTGR